METETPAAATLAMLVVLAVVEALQRTVLWRLKRDGSDAAEVEDTSKNHPEVKLRLFVAGKQKSLAHKYLGNKDKEETKYLSSP